MVFSHTANRNEIKANSARLLILVCILCLRHHETIAADFLLLEFWLNKSHRERMKSSGYAETCSRQKIIGFVLARQVTRTVMKTDSNVIV